MSTSKKVTVFAAPTLPLLSQRFLCCDVFVVRQWSRRYFAVFPLRFLLFLFLCPCSTLQFGKRLGLLALCVHTWAHTRRLDNAINDEMYCRE